MTKNVQAANIGMASGGDIRNVDGMSRESKQIDYLCQDWLRCLFFTLVC